MDINEIKQLSFFVVRPFFRVLMDRPELAIAPPLGIHCSIHWMNSEGK
jgi:hypothetical protein